MDANTLIEIAQLGAIPLLAAAVYVLWTRLNKVQDDFTEYLKESADRGDEAAQTVLHRKE